MKNYLELLDAYNPVAKSEFLDLIKDTKFNEDDLSIQYLITRADDGGYDEFSIRIDNLELEYASYPVGDLVVLVNPLKGFTKIYFEDNKIHPIDELFHGFSEDPFNKKSFELSKILDNEGSLLSRYIKISCTHEGVFTRFNQEFVIINQDVLDKNLVRELRDLESSSELYKVFFLYNNVQE